MTKVGATCPNDGNVDLEVPACLIDEVNLVWRFICPARCRRVITKRMDPRIYDLLRNAGVRTIEEVVISERVVLEDDYRIWEELGAS